MGDSCRCLCGGCYEWHFAPTKSSGTSTQRRVHRRISRTCIYLRFRVSRRGLEHLHGRCYSRVYCGRPRRQRAVLLERVGCVLRLRPWWSSRRTARRRHRRCRVSAWQQCPSAATAGTQPCSCLMRLLSGAGAPGLSCDVWNAMLLHEPQMRCGAICKASLAPNSSARVS